MHLGEFLGIKYASRRVGKALLRQHLGYLSIHLPRERGQSAEPPECVRPRRKGKGRTFPEMKVERNKRLGFNLVEGREGFHCAHWPNASRALRKDCDKNKSLCAKCKGEVQFGCAKFGASGATSLLREVEWNLFWICFFFFLPFTLSFKKLW